jgi:hypothetical protein
VITLRLATREEQYGLKCGARRAARGYLTCTMPALHRYTCGSWSTHSAQGGGGRWFFWEEQKW